MQLLLSHAHTYGPVSQPSDTTDGRPLLSAPFFSFSTNPTVNTNPSGSTNLFFSFSTNPRSIPPSRSIPPPQSIPFGTYVISLLRLAAACAINPSTYCNMSAHPTAMRSNAYTVNSATRKSIHNSSMPSNHLTTAISQCH